MRRSSSAVVACVCALLVLHAEARAQPRVRPIAELPPGRRIAVPPPDPCGSAVLVLERETRRGRAAWYEEPNGASATCLTRADGTTACMAPRLRHPALGRVEVISGFLLMGGGIAAVLATFEIDFCLDFSGTGSCDAADDDDGGEDVWVPVGSILALSGALLTMIGVGHNVRMRRGLRWLARQDVRASVGVLRDGSGGGVGVGIGF